MTAEEFLEGKGINLDYADTFLLVPISGDAEYSVFELMEEYADLKHIS